MSASNYPSFSATCAFTITASDTTDVKSDTANTEQVGAVYLHCTGTSGTAKVMPASGPQIAQTVYLIQGTTLPLAIRRLYATSPTPPTCIAFYGKQNI